MNILITGSAGLLGSNFVEYLIKNENVKTIIGIDDLSGSYIDNLITHEKYIYYKYNLQDYDNIENIFKTHKIDYIYHFAAYAAEGLSPFIRKFNYNNNLLCTTNLINMAIKYNIKRFVFTSSMAVYGRGNPPFEEKDTPQPIDPYGIAKYACEMDLKIAQEQHNLDYCIIRPHNVYGIKQNIWDVYRNVLGIWMYQILNDESMTIYGDGLQKRAFTYIDDIMEPLWNASQYEKSKNKIINLGGEDEITIKDAALILKEITQKGNIKHLEQRHEVKNAFCNHKIAHEILDFQMKTDLKTGLKKMWKWAQKQRPKQRFYWKEYELDKGIYSYWKK